MLSRQGLHSELAKARLQLQNAQTQVAALEAQLAEDLPQLALQDGEARYRHTLDLMLEGCQVIGFDWRYLYVNDTAARQGQRPKHELIGCTMMERYPGIETTSLFTVLQRCMQERRIERVENEFTYPDGTTAWFELSVQPVPEGIFILSLEITERKQAEENIRKLHRTLGVLSDINQAIVRIRHLPSLFTRACDIAVDKGAFRMAWIGLLDPQSRAIAPVAQAGIAARDLEKLLASLHSSPLSSAFRAGTRLICNELQTDPTWRPWHVVALQRNWRATVVLPLIVGGEIRGIFHLFASETHFFDAQEMQLIDEMAGDIAFAIEVAEQEEQIAHHTTTLEHKVAERTTDLQATLGRLEAILNNSPDAILLVDTDLTIQQTNQSFNGLFGAKGDTYLGQSFLTLLHPDDIHRITTLPPTGNPLEVRAIRKDGTTFDAELSIGHIEGDGLVYLIRDITKRKAQERQLRYHASIQESVSDAVIATDMDFRIQSWNHAAEMIYGWRAAETIGKPVNEVLQTAYGSAEDGERILRDFLARGAWQGEVIQQHRDGTLIDVHASVNLFKDETGQPIGVVSVNRDMTERKRAAAALQQSMEEIYDLYNHAPCGYHSIDQAGLIIQINDTELCWLGYTREEAIGRLNIAALLTPESTLTFQRVFPVFRAQGQLHDLELDMVRKDGSVLPILLNATAIYDADGQYLASRSTLFDMTKLQQAQQALVEREARYRLLAENISDVIAKMSPAGVRTFITPSCYGLLGYTPEELIGQPSVDIVHPEDRPQVLATIRQAVVERKTTFSFSWRFRHKAGHTIWVEVTNNVIYDGDTGQPLELIGVLREITERKQAEAALQESEERFRRAIIDAPFPIMIHAEGGEILHISNVWAEISGYTQAEIPTMAAWIEKAYRENSQTVRPLIEKVYTLTKPRRGGEFQIWTKAGEKRIWDFISAPLAVMPDGRQMVSSMAMDITERKQAEETLQAKMAEEHQFQLQLKALHEIIIELTGIDQLDMFYQRAVELGRERLGFERLAMFLYDAQDDSAVGTYGTDREGKLVDERGVRFTPDPNGIMQRSFERVERFYFHEATTLYHDAVAVGTGWNVAAVLWNGARSLGWFVADNLLSHRPASKLMLDTLGLYALSVGTLLAQKQTQLALQESEASYRLLAENLADIIMTFALDRRIIYMSPSCEKLLGYPPAEVEGKLHSEFIHPEDYPHVIDRTRQAVIAKEDAYTNLFRLRHKAGHYIWYEVRTRIVWEEQSGKIVQFVSVLRDITARKQAEDALRESEEKFRLLLNAAPVATIISDQAGRITLVNVQAEALFGYARNELVGQLVEILVPDYAHATHVSNRMRYVAAPRVRPMGLGIDLAARRKDGRKVPVEIELSYVETQTGIMVMSFIMDITDRKHIAAELEQQRSFLRNVIDVSPSMIYVKDYDGRFVLVNPSVATMYNTTIETLLGKTDADFNRNQHEVEDFLAADRLVITSGNALFVEEPLTNPTGKVRWLQTTKVPIVSADGQSNYVLGVSTDITERKEAEEALRASEEKYRSLIETMRGGLAVLDPEFRVTFVNDRFCELLGYTREEAMGKQPLSFVDPTELSLVQAQLERRQRAESTTYEIPIRHKDGHQLYLLLSGSPLLDAQGKYKGSIVVATDITVQKQAEATLRQALAKEKELGDLKTRFVSMASHEFRTPLATILAAVETLSIYRHKLSDEQIDKRFDKIKDQVGHLKAIMEDVLMLARMQTRRVEFQPVKLDLDALVRSVLEELRSQGDLKHRLEYQGSESIHEQWLDRKLMRQIVTNLLSNAIKYSAPGTVVHVQLDYDRSAIILTVRDEGIGIPAADLPHLFEPFHRAANVGTIAGTGLGLVITREAVELHGGTITVESRQDMGTTFLVRIPLSAAEDPPA